MHENKVSTLKIKLSSDITHTTCDYIPVYKFKMKTTLKMGGEVNRL